MDPDVLQAIRIIDEKIASLQEARNRLAQAFGVTIPPQPSKTSATATVTGSVSPLRQVPVSTAEGHNGHPAPRGRKEELAEFLRDHGPMSRADLLARAGMPEGTVAYCLNDKRFFEQKDDGNWDITDFSRRGLERRQSGTGLFQTEVQ